MQEREVQGEKGLDPKAFTEMSAFKRAQREHSFQVNTVKQGGWVTKPVGLTDGSRMTSWRLPKAFFKTALLLVFQEVMTI